MNNTIAQLTKVIDNSQKVLILSHVRPDGDSAGSSTAFYHILKQWHTPKEATLTFPDVLPAFLQWLPQVQEAKVLSEQSKETLKCWTQEHDLIVCLDTSLMERSGAIAPLLKNHQNKLLVIDHHKDFSPYGRWLFHNAQASSTCELVSQLAFHWHDQQLFTWNSAIATCLYTGLYTDTGGFRFRNTSEQTLWTAAKLVSLGAEPQKIAYHLTQNTPLYRLRFLGTVLKDFLRFLPQYRTAYAMIPRSLQLAFQLQPGDTSEIVDYVLRIQGVNLAITLREEEPNKIRLSFRSIGDFPANELAKKHFNGGGHKNAAGGELNTSLQEAETYLLNVLQQYQNQLQYEPYETTSIA